nr:MAG TPA: hypothetical protein [Caudoviricetes sp.]
MFFTKRFNYFIHIFHNSVLPVVQYHKSSQFWKMVLQSTDFRTIIKA